MPASLLPDYSNQAQTYDLTRAASPSVLAALRLVLAGASGRRLADIGGGTGNYAAALALEGWDPVVIDRSPEMLTRARDKGLATISADAQQLPLQDGSFDAAMLVSMLHHVEDPVAALSEDLEDASLAALSAHPEKVLDERWRTQTSYFERLQRDHPQELHAGLERLRERIADGDAPSRPGRASMLAWTKG